VLKRVEGVTISGITLDGSSLQLACPNEGFYPGRCEGRHAVSIRGDSADITIENCHFVGLVGDGVAIGKLAPGIDPAGPGAKTPHSIVVRNNTFSAWPEHRNRNGVSVGAVSDLLIAGNHFEQMGRGYFGLTDYCEVDPGGGLPNCRLGPPVSMPGPIDLEPDHQWAETVERVEIADNTIIGWEGCLTNTGIGVSNHADADVTLRDVRIRDNRIYGCFDKGILVAGSGTEGHPIVVQDNILKLTRPHPRIPNRWGIAVGGKVIENVHTPSYVDIRANEIIGDAEIDPEDGIVSNGESMIGLYIRASKAVVAANCIQGARRLGLDFDERYETDPTARFSGQSVFCGNLLHGNGTDPGRSAMTLSGGCHQVESNLIEASPRGVEVLSGMANEFISNSFQDVDACDVHQCVHCAETPNAGCQLFGGLPPNPNETNCVSCAPNASCVETGGGGIDPIVVEF
jgi:hypothetical protein